MHHAAGVIIASFALPENSVVPEFDGLAELYFEKAEDIARCSRDPFPG